MEESEVSRLKTRAEYQALRANAFPSESALSWFMRRHRETLVAAKALVPINRRMMLDPPNFDRVVRQVGQASLAEAA